MCIQNIASEQFSTETSNHVIISIYNRMQLHGHVFEKYQPVGFLTVEFFFCVSDHKLNISKAEILLDLKVNPNF